jgi:amino acid adenylation domain-containing protein
MRLHLIRLRSDKHVLLWSYHHLLLDGWCLPIILKDVFVLYETLTTGKQSRLALGRPYRDYILWLQSQDRLKAESFWRTALKGFRTPISLARPEVLRQTVLEDEDACASQGTAAAPLNAELLNLFARRHQLTMNTLVLGAWALVLSRYCGGDDIVTGATVSGRPPEIAGVDRMVGLFINTLPIRVQARPENDLLRWLKKLQENMAEWRQHQYTPLIDIRGWSEIPGSTQLFDCILVFENYPMDESLGDFSCGLQVGDVRHTSRNNYPLTLVVTPRGGAVRVEAAYDSRSIDAQLVSRLLGSLVIIVDSMTTGRPGRRLCDFSVFGEHETHALVTEWNDTLAQLPFQGCVSEVFEAQVERFPDAPALFFEGHYITYSELNRRANQLAGRLILLGLGLGDLAGIYLHPSLDVIVSLLAVLKTGAAYLPIEAAWPAQRLAFIVGDSALSVMITNAQLAKNLPPLNAALVCVDLDADTIEAQPGRNPGRTALPQCAAYVIYTSGSTGKPKGVVVEQRQIMNYLIAIIWRAGITAGASFAMVQTLAVDSCNTVLYPALLSGGCLHVISREVAGDPLCFEDYFSSHAIEHLKIVPSHLAALQDTTSPERLLPCRWLILGGEASRADWTDRIKEMAPHCQILNHYGPTETTVGVLTSLFKAGDSDWTSSANPIGRPIANCRAYVVDRWLQILPFGVVGELCIGGAPVARGYLNRPEVTAEKFVPDPFSSVQGARMYATGDVVRRASDGVLTFLGRRDDQVKIRGFRIDVQEVEASFLENSSVSNVKVLPREGENGQKRLVAYVVTARENGPSVHDLRAFLNDRLPDYMVPSSIIRMEALPLMPSGKVDRAALASPDEARQEERLCFEGPRTATEDSIARIWARLLDVQRVDVNENFFELGGHSLMATQVVARVREMFQVELPLRRLFDTPTVSGLVVTIAQVQAQKLDYQRVEQILADLERLSETEAQRRILSS